MKLLSLLFFWIGLFLFQPLASQPEIDFSKESVANRIRADVYALASEEMEGREAGTPGEVLAASYIEQRMKEIGLLPLFDGSYFQEFPIPGSWTWGSENALSHRGVDYEHGEDFFAIPGSFNGHFRAEIMDLGFGLCGSEMQDLPLSYCDYDGKTGLEGKFFLMEYYLPDSLEAALDVPMFQTLQMRVTTAVEKGASGVVFTNTCDTRSDPPIDMRVFRSGIDIPVIFARGTVFDVSTIEASGLLELTVDVYRPDLFSMNVAGYIDNDAPHTVVIGGHYDHVGYGAQGSRSPGSNAIHYGADDNASGTAGILEAARYISQSSLSDYNYLFIAFGAEEKGLLGSRFFAESGVYDMDRVNYMFNLDMIGRMESSVLTLIGTGSSPSWDRLIDQHAPDHMQIRKNPSGRGGSDHTSFYVKDIPVLFFFTGIHEDYHTPADTPDRVNYEGAAEVLAFALDMITHLDERDMLAFSSAAAPTAPARSRAGSVGLGLMPDHGYDGEGLRVMSVLDDRPAKKAGMENGDVIRRINNVEILHIDAYMEALSQLREGSTATVVVERDGEMVSLSVDL